VEQYDQNENVRCFVLASPQIKIYDNIYLTEFHFITLVSTMPIFFEKWQDIK
jgi:hypothetical protein